MRWEAGRPKVLLPVPILLIPVARDDNGSRWGIWSPVLVHFLCDPTTRYPHKLCLAKIDQRKTWKHDNFISLILHGLILIINRILDRKMSERCWVFSYRPELDRKNVRTLSNVRTSRTSSQGDQIFLKFYDFFSAVQYHYEWKNFREIRVGAMLGFSPSLS